MAWLNATKEGEKQSRRESLLEGGEGSPLLLMPPVYEGHYLIELWHEAGTLESNGMGISKLSWQEINGWLSVRQKVGDPPLLHWEVELVRKLSEEYSSEYNQASDKNREAPYQADSLDDLDRAAVASKTKNIFASIRENAKQKYIVED